MGLCAGGASLGFGVLVASLVQHAIQMIQEDFAETMIGGETTGMTAMHVNLLDLHVRMTLIALPPIAKVSA